MRLAPRLVLLLAASAAVPLALTTAVTLPRSTAELRRHLDGLFRANADTLAGEFDRLIEERAAALQLYSSAVDLGQFEDDDASLQAALRLAYQQTRDASAVALVDASGNPLTEPVRFAKPREAGFAQQEGTDVTLASFGAHLPYREAAQLKRVVVGPHYVVSAEDGMPMPRVALAAPTQGADGQTWILAVEISLRPMVERVANFGIAQTGAAALLTAEGQVIAAGPLWKQDAPRIVGASTKLSNLPWTVAVQQEQQEALAPLRRYNNGALVWALVGLSIAVVMGVAGLRPVTRQVEQLQDAAAKVEAGDLSVSVSGRGSDEMARLGRAFNAMVQRLRERDRLRQSFSRYMSPAVADRILREASDFEVRDEAADVTVMFIDVRGFTTLAERLTSSEVVEALNEFFDRIVQVVHKHDGVVLKFIGDAVMVMFGIPRELPNPELRAVTAALEIQEATEEVNRNRVAVGREPLRFGIGINSGPVIAGNVGSSARLEYTVIGDAVNVAARLEALARPGDVVISAETRDRINAPLLVESLGEIGVKGRLHPVAVFRVLGRPGKLRDVS